MTKLVYEYMGTDKGNCSFSYIEDYTNIVHMIGIYSKDSSFW